LSEELSVLKLTMLQKRASSSACVDEIQIDDALDSDDPKGALIMLLLAVPFTVPFGNADAPDRSD
jgi:hypothetical protein